MRQQQKQRVDELSRGVQSFDSFFSEVNEAAENDPGAAGAQRQDGISKKDLPKDNID